MALFHSREYLEFIEQSSFNQSSESKSLESITEKSEKPTFKLGESGDCPLFDGLYDFCRIATGGSWDSAILLAENEADIAINWAGGLHHAKK